MKKRWIVLALVLCLSLVLAIPAGAAGALAQREGVGAALAQLAAKVCSALSERTEENCREPARSDAAEEVSQEPEWTREIWVNGERMVEILGEPPASTAPAEETENGMRLGLGKGDAMIAVIDTVFGYDLSGYQYISAAELWTNEPLPSDQQPMQDIWTDWYMSAKEGERMPLGYLYQGDTAYTAVKQPGNGLKLIKYETDPNPAPEDLRYCVVETKTVTASRDVLDTLYSQ